MDILPYSFKASQIAGIWYENNRFFVFKSIYTTIIILMVINTTLGQALLLATMEGDVDEFTETMFLTLSFVALSCKIFNFVSRRSEMADLLSEFRLLICQPKSQEEKEIIEKFSKTAMKIFLFILGWSESAGSLVMLSPLLTPQSNITELLLPFKAYQLYSINSPTIYYLTYVLQFISGIYGILLDVTLDTMMYGFIIMATAQFEINCYRLENSSESIKHCFEHNLIIQNIVSKIQSFYIPVIVPIFFFSLITLCTSIFQMSQKSILTYDFWSLISYVITMLFQVFLYCWFGNELELKSKAVTHAIYSRDWMDSSIEEKKSMLFLMLSTQNGSNISFRGQCDLSVNTFVWVVKTAYSALNLLQQASDK